VRSYVSDRLVVMCVVGDIGRFRFQCAVLPLTGTLSRPGQVLQEAHPRPRRPTLSARHLPDSGRYQLGDFPDSGRCRLGDSSDSGRCQTRLPWLQTPSGTPFGACITPASVARSPPPRCSAPCPLEVVCVTDLVEWFCAPSPHHSRSLIKFLCWVLRQ
jgi:hypothetical protein